MMTNNYSNKTKLSLSILPFSSAVISMLLFIIGVAEYRFFLINAMFMLAIAVATYFQFGTNTLKKMMVVCLIISIYYDFTFGPIRGSNYNLNIFIAILADFSISALLNKHLKRFIEYYSDNKVFSLCPNCMFDSNDINTTCSECGFNSNINSITQNNLNPSLLEIVQLKGDESIKMTVKTGGSLATNTIYENNIKVFASHIIITDKRIIIIRKRIYERGWSYKKNIQISSIKSVLIEPKIYFSKNIKSIKIELIDGNYLNIYFVRFGNNDKENEELLSCLNKAKNEN